MARSPSGERRPSVSRRATTPLLWPVASPTASHACRCSLRRREAGRNKNDARVSGERPAPRFCCRESRAQQSISDERLTCVGLDKAQAGGENAGPSLRYSNLRAVGWVTGCFPLLGRTGIVCRAIFWLKNFKCFFFSKTGINYFN
jgi:hypothetical protein